MSYRCWFMLVALTAVIAILAGCGGSGSSSSSFLSRGAWTWIGGSSIAGASGAYGTEGTAASTNIPGARNSAATWVDLSGSHWLFGGSGYDGSGNLGDLNDLWEYSPASGAWTWVGGSSTGNASGTSGVQSAAASTNVPGARSCAVSWVDSSGNLWLFGGGSIWRFGSGGILVLGGDLNELWKY